MAAICLGVCAYDKMDIKTVTSILNCFPERLIHEFVFVEATLLPQARNEAFKIALTRPNWTHFLFVDADQCGFDGRHLKKLVDQDKDIIAGVTSSRKPLSGKDDLHPTFNPLPDTPKEVTTETFEVDFTGFFFTLIKREVIEALREDNEIWFACDREPDQSWYVRKKQLVNQLEGRTLTKSKIEELINFGRFAYEGGTHMGEDVYFCHKARRAGFKVWVDASIRVGHIGQKVFFP